MIDSYQSLVKNKRSIYQDILYCYRGYKPEYITSIIDEFYTKQKIPSIISMDIWWSYVCTSTIDYVSDRLYRDTLKQTQKKLVAVYSLQDILPMDLIYSILDKLTFKITEPLLVYRLQ